MTICGEPFGHLLFHFVLSHSGWRYVDVAYGETFVALVAALVKRVVQTAKPQSFKTGGGWFAYSLGDQPGLDVGRGHQSRK